MLCPKDMLRSKNQRTLPTKGRKNKAAFLESGLDFNIGIHPLSRDGFRLLENKGNIGIF
jgi:hypothetical protein